MSDPFVFENTGATAVLILTLAGSVVCEWAVIALPADACLSTSRG